LFRPGARGLLIGFWLMVGVAVSLLLARFIVLPVRRLQSAGQKVAAGDLSVRVAHTVGNRTDDIARLARDFDLMTERVDGLLQSQQRLMRDVSHELRSPLARLQALLSIARQKADAAGAEQIDRMEAELERLDRLIGDILAFSRLEAKEAISRHPTDIVDLVQNIVDDASIEAQAAGKQIRMHGPTRCLIDVDSGLIQRAVENVVRNALRHTAEGTAVNVSIDNDARYVRIVTDDQGPGVPEEAIAKLFEPFFRVEQSRSTRSGGGGIGLAIAERSIRLHGGSIRARNRKDGGLSIAIALPNGR
jgi:two-component system sensor histidine kinase CpxA